MAEDSKEGRAVVEMEKISISVPKDVHRALKIEAAETGRTMGEIVVEALTSSRITFLPRALRRETK